MEAITWFDNTLAIDPKDVYALHNKDVALNVLGQQD
jgi:hypothetical protein